MVALPAPPSLAVVMNAPLTDLPGKPWTVSPGEWEATDGGLWGSQKGKEDKAATMRVPLSLSDGMVDLELNFRGASRISLRFESEGKKHSFRVVVSRSSVEIAKNPSQGEAKDAVDQFARKPLKLDSNRWYPVRITFSGNEITAQVNDVIAKGTHEVVGKEKTGVNLLVFGEKAGFRNVKVVK